MDTDRRWVLSVVAALVVAAVVVGGWWLSQPRPAGGTAGGTAGVGAGGGTSSEPGTAGVGSDPRAGGTAEPGQPSVGRHPMLRKHGVRVDGYAARGNRLLVRYINGVPECYGEVEVADVTQDAESVTVTLVAVPPEQSADVCIDLAVLGTATVELARPLGNRSVLDGAYTPAVRVMQRADKFAGSS